MANTDKVAELHEQIAAGVEELTTSEGWQRWLATASRFHNYSVNNQLLIALQRPGASAVAGFQTWRSLGRTVNKGEKGIAILAPMRFSKKVENEETGDEKKVNGVRGFKAAHVFDVSQTSGEPLPEPPVRLLAGEAPEGLYDFLAAQVEGHGLAFSREAIEGGANGFTDFLGKRVVVRDDLDPAQATKTLAHELGHVLLHENVDYAAERQRCEVEAESVAYIVCNEAGLTTADYSFGYIANWGGADRTDLIKETAERVRSAASSVITARHQAVEQAQEMQQSEDASVVVPDARQGTKSPAPAWEQRVRAAQQRARSLNQHEPLAAPSLSA